MKRRIGIMALSILIMVGFFGCASNSSKSKTITVGSKNYTENIVLSHLMADIIEDRTDITVERKENLGGSNIAWEALQNDEIQLYPDYTGTIVADYYQEQTHTSEETLKRAVELTSEEGLALTGPFGFNNTYTLAVTQETAKKYNLETFSDLVSISPDFILGCEFEFKDRDDGYPGLKKAYGMNFKEVTGMDHGIMYTALTEGNVDVIDSYVTDGQLVVNHLAILKDDLEFFPPYDAVPIVRQDTLDQYPEIEDALNLLSGLLDEKTMRSLNAKVDSDGLKAQNVAHDFLVSVGLIKN
ncbi:MAG: glycine/betaine ABC transporter substrate-binding protein [Oscillospiraceae bacterium]|jgi:osmoprotectant transport system substrate-binding protein|nr:glycine/betaine ABC transporter substrate-binding protein [Oscillospiraceae bacterium]